MPAERPAEPWLSFLTELDAQLEETTDFHCIGGFVISQHYGFRTETSDLDILRVIPHEAADRAIQLPGKGSALHQKYKVYLDHVSVANYPESYEARLIRAFPIWSKVRLWLSNRTTWP